MENYLVLTVNGVGSTYLQRALTIFLNSAGYPYYNTHDLLSNIGFHNGNMIGVYPPREKRYDMPVREIVAQINRSKNLLVSRIAKWNADQRGDDCTEVYKAASKKFSRVILCQRNPYEFALSHIIRRQTPEYNNGGNRGQYTLADRIKHFSGDRTWQFDREHFISKLDEYNSGDYWASDNFEVTDIMDYDDFYEDPDGYLQKLTGIDYSIKDRFGIGFFEYSKLIYQLSIIKEKQLDYPIDKDIAQAAAHFTEYQIDLHENHILPSRMPMKRTILKHKQERMVDFKQSLDVYNEWASNKNNYLHITEDMLQSMISREIKLYELEDLI